MSDKRYIVPEGMLKAADKAIGEMRAGQASRLASRDGELWPNELKRVVLEAALAWLAENPIIPRDENELNQLPIQRHEAIAEWQRIMFLAPEPGTHPLQCGERFEVRGETWQVETIIEGNKAWMKLIVPEPRVPEPVRGLLFDKLRTDLHGDEANQRIFVAYKRGRKENQP